MHALHDVPLKKVIRWKKKWGRSGRQGCTALLIFQDILPVVVINVFSYREVSR